MRAGIRFFLLMSVTLAATSVPGGRRLTAAVGVSTRRSVTGESVTPQAAANGRPSDGRSEPDPGKPIVDGMQRAEAQLKQGDTGEATRALEERVVNDLQKLIDASKPSRRPKPRPDSGSRQQTGSQGSSSSSSQGNQPAGSAAQPTKADQPGRRSGTARPKGAETRTAEVKHHFLSREVWGHLPPALRERVPTDFQETALPAYDDLVRRYFDSLLEQGGALHPGAD